MSREQILEKIRKSRRSRVELPAELPSFPEYEDPVAHFRLEAERVGTRVLEGDNLEAALTTVLSETGARRLYWQGGSALEPFGDEVRPLPSGPEDGSRRLIYSEHADQVFRLPLRLEMEPYDRAKLAQAEVSVGKADWGIAETGTATESTAGAAGRVLPILAPNHVQILSRSQIRMNVAEFLSTISLSADESARILMTGPSRTADIEKILILGVHGPRQLYVILVP